MVEPWIIIKDFNTLLCTSDKNGGRMVRNSNDYVFGEFFWNLRGMKLDFVGSKFMIMKSRSLKNI